mmetsp:Transcript_12332/g.17138  ORF Transcript_12332/g.17138 Transcript_12332/m.17138 type:complete len:378 (+) Transcript_12332:231-1364(+)
MESMKTQLQHLREENEKLKRNLNEQSLHSSFSASRNPPGGLPFATHECNAAPVHETESKYGARSQASANDVEANPRSQQEIDNGTWEWDDNGSWAPYEGDVNAAIDQVFQSQLEAKSRNLSYSPSLQISVLVNGKQIPYEVNPWTGLQQNRRTGNKRRIRRIVEDGSVCKTFEAHSLNRSDRKKYSNHFKNLVRVYDALNTRNMIMATYWKGMLQGAPLEQLLEKVKVVAKTKDMISEAVGTSMLNMINTDQVVLGELQQHLENELKEKQQVQQELAMFRQFRQRLKNDLKIPATNLNEIFNTCRSAVEMNAKYEAQIKKYKKYKDAERKLKELKENGFCPIAPVPGWEGKVCFEFLRLWCHCFNHNHPTITPYRPP